MPRARKKKVTILASGDELYAGTRGAKRRAASKAMMDARMGDRTVSSQDADDLHTHAHPGSVQCPSCSSFLKPAVVPAGPTPSLLQCPQCSRTPLCEHCLYHCPDGTCTNKSCQVVSLLLTCDAVTNLDSNIYNCPLFRACPKCHSIMMHQTGCKYVTCAHCRYNYCFICLRIRQECTKDKNKYWSLTCSAPTAPRQRFQT